MIRYDLRSFQDLKTKMNFRSHVNGSQKNLYMDFLNSFISIKWNNTKH